MLTEMGTINYKNVINVKDVTGIYIGHEAEEAIRTVGISKMETAAIKGKILNFYQKLCDEILSRTDINNNRLTTLRYLDPIFIKSSEEINYFELVSAYSQIIIKPEAFINELKLLECKAMDESYKHRFDITDLEVFWFKVSQLKNNFNERLYQNLYEFVGYIVGVLQKVLKSTFL